MDPHECYGPPHINVMKNIIFCYSITMFTKIKSTLRNLFGKTKRRRHKTRRYRKKSLRRRTMRGG